MAADLSVWNLFSHASFVVKSIILLLLSCSLFSWSIIFYNFIILKNVRKNLHAFRTSFWSGLDLLDLYTKLNNKKNNLLGIENIFFNGFKEFLRLSKNEKIPAEHILNGIERSIQVSIMRESNEIESHLTTLATLGSISPYIGLFGTVWGIMHSFVSLSGVQQATLSMVAPGIAEALVATAMGLFVAIPAVIFYNKFCNNSHHILSEYEKFQEEFIILLQREVYRR